MRLAGAEELHHYVKQQAKPDKHHRVDYRLRLQRVHQARHEHRICQDPDAVAPPRSARQVEQLEDYADDK